MDLGEKAKRTLQAFIPVIDEKISSYFTKELSSDFGFNLRQKRVVKEALLHAQELVLRPQKHLRGAFVVNGYLLSGKKISESVWAAAVAVEMVHGALLMHDDFMDQDEIRRKGPTTHKYYQEKFGGNLHLGESMAVSVGDALLCLGFDLLTRCENDLVTNQMLRAIANTGFGQAYDVSLEAFQNWSEEDVLALHRAKTAIYTYENPLLIGADLAMLSVEAKNILGEYAKDGGVAFQLRDDILGVFGDPSETGKSANSDLLQGKCTLLVWYVFNKGTLAQKTAVQKVWGRKKVSQGDIDNAKTAIKLSGSLDYSVALTRQLAAKAAATANKLRKLKLNPEAIDYIQGVAEYMVKRVV